MKAGLLSLAICLFALGAKADFDPNLATYEGFISISAKKELYVEYVSPKNKMPLVVLLNGLTYSTRQWEDFTRALTARGIGVLRYDMYGMGKTLVKYAPVTTVIPVEDQVRDLKALFKAMKIKGPYNLVGLSYGGGVAAGYAAAYPEEIKNLVMMAPFTRALDSQDQWIRAQIWATRQIFPYNKLSDDELYDYFLHQIIYATYPQSEPSALENPFKLEGIFRMVQGIRKFRAVDYAPLLPAKKLHLVIARQDQYINTSVLEEYWQAAAPEARASLLYINGSEHKIVEAVPNFSAAWVAEIVNGNSRLFKGRTFEGYPYRGEVRSENDTINIGKE